MLAYSLKEILDLVPEAAPFVKQASIEQEMPLDNKDSCIATALQVKYHEKIAFKPLDVFALDKVAKAVKLYGVEDQVTALTECMVKAASSRLEKTASALADDYHTKEAFFEGELSGMRLSTVELSKQASDLYDIAQDAGIQPSEAVVRYSGHGYLDKEAAVKSLAIRFYETKNTDFVKIATAIGTKKGEFQAHNVRDICDTISEMDKTAGLSTKGFNFYNEAILTKEAALTSSLQVKLCGKQVPFEKIAKLGRGRFEAYMGKDIGAEYDLGPMHFKQTLEALPMDLQKIALHLTNNV